MKTKPSYQELEDRIQVLEKRLSEYSSTDNSYLCHLEAILNNTNMPIYLKDSDYNYLYVNKQYEMLAHVTNEKIQGKDDFAIFPQEIAELFRSQDEEVVERLTLVEFEETIQLPDGILTFLTAKFPLLDNEGKVFAVGGVCTNITAQKKAEALLQEAHEKLELRVANRTSELNAKTSQLMEANIALNVLLEKRNEEKQELGKKLVGNIEKLIKPYLEKLRLSLTDKTQEALLAIIQTNLSEITSSFEHNPQEYLYKLTPTQIQIVDLIKQGRTTKEIAEILNLSPSTIACHRQEIRKRLSLTNKNINLQTALQQTLTN